MLLTLAVNARAAWIVDPALESSGFGTGVVSEQLRYLGVNAAGDVYALPTPGSDEIIRIPAGGGAVDNYPVPVDIGPELITSVRVGPGGEVYALSLDFAGPGKVWRLDGGAFAPFASMPLHGFVHSMAVDQVTGDILVQATDGGSDGDPGTIYRFNSAGSQLYSASTGAISLKRVAFDESGDSFMVTEFGEIYELDGSGVLTPTGKAVSQYAGIGIGVVDSYLTKDGVHVFGVQGNPSFLVGVDGGGDTVLFAYGEEELPGDLAVGGPGSDLYVPNVISGELSLFGSFAMMAAQGDAVTIIEGDLSQQLLGLGAIPEPSTLPLLMIGTGLIAWKRNRKWRNSSTS